MNQRMCFECCVHCCPKAALTFAENQGTVWVCNWEAGVEQCCFKRPLLPFHTSLSLRKHKVPKKCSPVAPSVFATWAPVQLQYQSQTDSQPQHQSQTDFQLPLIDTGNPQKQGQNFL